MNGLEQIDVASFTQVTGIIVSNGKFVKLEIASIEAVEGDVLKIEQFGDSTLSHAFFIAESYEVVLGNNRFVFKCKKGELVIFKESK